ncbi:MAG: hypothetical protein ACD_75C01204G0002 [uncultured bacterium]|nr:MAG: hypothetical protein ACD_75C01204G0002 [uncultured bacterium]
MPTFFTVCDMILNAGCIHNLPQILSGGMLVLGALVADELARMYRERMIKKN